MLMVKGDQRVCDVCEEPIPRGTSYHFGYTTPDAVAQWSDDPRFTPSFTPEPDGTVRTRAQVRPEELAHLKSTPTCVRRRSRARERDILQLQLAGFQVTTEGGVEREGEGDRIVLARELRGLIHGRST